MALIWKVDVLPLAGGSALVTDAPLRSLRVVWSIDGPGSFECELGSDSATQWLAGQRRIKVKRSGTAKWLGWLDELVEDANSWDDLEQPGGVNLRASGVGLAGRFDRRVVHGDFSKTAVVATTIAWNLIQHIQAQSEGDYGITLGTITGTAPARTRHYCDGDFIHDAINELATKESGGFDWEVDETGAFKAWVGGRGTDVSGTVTLQRSDQMTWAVQDQPSNMVTYATAMGTEDEPCGAPLVTTSSALKSTYGRLESVVDLETDDSAELTDAADDELRSRTAARRRVRATWPESDPPPGFTTFGTRWLGDIVSVVLPSYQGGTQDMRIIEVVVSVEPPGEAAETYIEYELEAV